MGALEVIQLLNTLVLMLDEASKAVQEVNSVIAKARSENRDITLDEIQAAKAARERALDNLREAIAK